MSDALPMSLRSLLLGALALAAPAALAQDAPPENWHLLDRDADGVAGISLDAAYAALGDREPTEVVVAIIELSINL